MSAKDDIEQIMQKLRDARNDYEGQKESDKDPTTIINLEKKLRDAEDSLKHSNEDDLDESDLEELKKKYLGEDNE
jgi:hypothetical protein